MGFIVSNCIRCGVQHVQMLVTGSIQKDDYFSWEIFVCCSACKRGSIYECRLRSTGSRPEQYSSDLADSGEIGDRPIRFDLQIPNVPNPVPTRVADLFKEAASCRAINSYEAAGAMFRKTIDVATKHIYATDERLKDKKPADALRSRITALGQMKILDEDIVELADVAALDGNDAAHDVDPYTAEEAEALEELTSDLLDRLFVRPARIAAVRAKQIAAGQRRG